MAKDAWWVGPKGEGYVVIQFVLLGLIALAPASGPLDVGWPPALVIAARVVAVGLLLYGMPIGAAGLLGLGRNLTAVPRPRPDGSLVQHGAYRLVRHPIYSGIIAASFALALLRQGEVTLIFALLLFVLFDVKSRREEQWLIEQYPAYVTYQQRVRKLIPFVY